MSSVLQGVRGDAQSLFGCTAPVSCQVSQARGPGGQDHGIVAGRDHDERSPIMAGSLPVRREAGDSDLRGVSERPAFAEASAGEAVAP